jgi:hypothetical protein
MILLPKSAMCTLHNDPFRFFDRDCGRLICRDCFVLEYMGHKCQGLAEALTACCAEVGELARKAGGRAAEMEAAVVTFARASAVLDENFAEETYNKPKKREKNEEEAKEPSRITGA